MISEAERAERARYGSIRAGWLPSAWRWTSSSWRSRMWRDLRYLLKESKTLWANGAAHRAALARAEAHGFIARVREMLKEGLLK